MSYEPTNWLTDTDPELERWQQIARGLYYALLRTASPAEQTALASIASALKAYEQARPQGLV